MKGLEKNSKIYVAGHKGLVGSAIVRNLKSKGYTNIIGKTHKELDLTNQADVKKFFEEEKPTFLAAPRLEELEQYTSRFYIRK